MPVDRNDPRFRALATGIRQEMDPEAQTDPQLLEMQRRAKMQALAQMGYTPPPEQPRPDISQPMPTEGLTPEEERDREYIRNKYRLGQ